MTAGGRYLAGLLVVATVGLAAVFTVSPDIRREVAWGIGVALLVQAPLGWWTVRSIGTDRFQLVWVLGMVIRLALVAIAGLILVPELRWELVADSGGTGRHHAGAAGCGSGGGSGEHSEIKAR